MEARRSAKRGATEARKWIGRHWCGRSEHNLLPSVRDLPEDVEAIIERNALTERESDHLVVNMEVGLQGCLAVELKHSVERTLRKDGQQTTQNTTIPCVLPTLRLLKLGDSKNAPRLLSGLELLSIQGIPREYSLAFAESRPQGNLQTDKLCSDLAGNAFAGGCFAAVLRFALSCCDFSKAPGLL